MKKSQHYICDTPDELLYICMYVYICVCTYYIYNHIYITHIYKIMREYQTSPNQETFYRMPAFNISVS